MRPRPYLRLAVSVASFGFIALNLLFWCIPLLVPSAFKLVRPKGRSLRRSRNAIYRLAVRLDDWWLRRVLGIRWNRPDLRLDPEGVYIVLANHRSWIDIFVIQSVIARTGPVVTFLTKRELAYIPVLGLIFYAFDFPLLRRRAARSESEDEHRRQDARRIRDACAVLKEAPSAILSFAEGTRFTRQKQIRSESQFGHLLPPRPGGFARLLEGLGTETKAIVDLTLVYPEEATYWSFLGGGVREIEVFAEVLPPDVVNSAEAPTWLVGRWKAKDELIDRVRRSPG